MLQIELTCILCDTGEKVSYTFCSCAREDFPASDANPVHPPLAEFCVPCVPSGTGTKKQPSQSKFQKNHLSHLLGPRRPRAAGFHPRWGTTRPSPGRSRFGPHRGEFGRKERKQRNPESSRQRRRRIRKLLTSHRAHGFLKNQQWREV